MRRRLARFLDRHAVPEWRRAHHLWSVQIAVVWTCVQTAYACLPYFADLLGPLRLSLLSIAFAVLLLLARLTHQPGLDHA